LPASTGGQDDWSLQQCDLDALEHDEFFSLDCDCQAETARSANQFCCLDQEIEIVLEVKILLNNS
jgi:hypothetical protein